MEKTNIAQNFKRGISCCDVFVGKIISENGEYKEHVYLLVKKPNQDKYRFIGGFFSPDDDNSLQDTAIREMKEETGLVGMNPHFLTSLKVDDHRYRSDKDKVCTSLFVIEVPEGSEPVLADDLAGGGFLWFVLEQLKNVDIIEEHKTLLQAAIEYAEFNELCYG